MPDHDSNSETEEILLSRPEETQFPSDSTEFNSVSVKFSQAHRTHLESKKFRIYDHKFLQVLSFKNNIQQQYWINLAYVNSKIDRKIIVNKLWLWFFLILASFASAAFYLPYPETIESYSRYRIPISILLITLASLSLVTLFAKTRSVVNLRSSNGAAPMVEILYNNPNKAAYNHFLRQLAESVHIAQSNNDIDDSQKLAAELKDHRRLRDQGILSSDNYNKAKELIFSLHSKSSGSEKVLPY